MLLNDGLIDFVLEIGKRDEYLICGGSDWRKEYQLELGEFGLSLLRIKNELVYSMLQRIEATRAFISTQDCLEPLAAVDQCRVTVEDLKKIIHDDYYSAILLLMPLSGQLAIKNRNDTLIKYEKNEHRMITSALRSSPADPKDPIYQNRYHAQERLANDLSGYEALYQWARYLREFDLGSPPNSVAYPKAILNGAKAHLDLICATLAELDKIKRMFPLYLNRDNARYFLVSEKDTWLTEAESYINEIQIERGTRIRCDSLMTTLAGEQHSLRESRRYIHTCQVCGRYFFNAYPDAKYCSGYAPQKPEMLCKDFGKTMVSEKRDQMLGYHDYDEARKSYAKWKHRNMERIDQIIHENVDKKTVDIQSFISCKEEIQKLHEAWKAKARQALFQYNKEALTREDFLIAIKLPSFRERGPAWHSLKKAWSDHRTKKRIGT